MSPDLWTRAGPDASTNRLKSAVATVVLVFLLYRTWIVFYNIFLHPLRNVPGPKSRAVSYLPNALSVWLGRDFLNIKALHDKYGPVVRITPEYLSFNTAKAFQDIYGFQKGRRQIPKDPEFYLPENIHAQTSLINANDTDHARMRRLVAHAFSNTALQEQEDLLKVYFDLFVDRLKKVAAGPGTTDMSAFFNFLTWDIIGDLALGEAFGMLEGSNAPTFMWNAMGAANMIVIFWIALWVPLFGLGMRLYFKLTNTLDSRSKMIEFTRGRVNERLAETPSRPDFISYILRHNDGRAMTHGEIVMTLRTFLNAGSETTASTLSWCLWEILQDPEIHDRLRKEVRSSFHHADEISIKTTSQQSLPFLFALIEETLRRDPATVGPSFARKTIEPTLIDGNLVPPGIRVGVHHYSSFHSAANFRDPEMFVPERWLGDSNYKNDIHDAFQPFSSGPRVCLGRNLAYAEMTSILARLVYNFDMSLAKESVGWGIGMKARMFWLKPPLLVNFKLADHVENDGTRLEKLQSDGNQVSQGGKLD